MNFFTQNGELTIPPLSPLVAKNTFLSLSPDQTPLPQFSDIRTRLPRPIWDGHERHIACYWRTWELAFSKLRTPKAESGFVSPFIDTAFNDCIFMWDSAFILMFGKYADRIFKFQGTLDNFYSHQHRDGFICREIEEETGHEHFTRYDPSGTGPEVLPWCEWEYYQNFGDKVRLARVYPPLLAYHNWMRQNRTWRDGTYFSTGWGCGMDNIPRQQAGYSPEFSHGHMVWVDTCMQELLSCNILIAMANELGETDTLDELTAERDNLHDVINQKLWDEKTGFYYDLRRNGKHNGVRHIGAFWALISECAPQERAKRLIAYLQDEKEFKTEFRVPALSASDPNFRTDGGYWRGGVWAPTNYMVLKGLDRYGEYALAHEIASESLDAVVRVFERDGTIYENYAPRPNMDGEPTHGAPAKRDFIGWSGLFSISVLFEYVFGIKPDAANATILWDVRLTERHGITNYPFGNNGELTLICEARENENEKPQITFSSNVPVKLHVLWGDAEHKHSEIIEC